MCRECADSREWSEKTEREVEEASIDLTSFDRSIKILEEMQVTLEALNRDVQDIRNEVEDL